MTNNKENTMTKNETTKVLGTVTEVDTKQVTEVFGKDIGKRLENCEGKTFLDILINSGWFNLTSADK